MLESIPWNEERIHLCGLVLGSREKKIECDLEDEEVFHSALVMNLFVLVVCTFDCLRLPPFLMTLWDLRAIQSLFRVSLRDRREIV